MKRAPSVLVNFLAVLGTMISVQAGNAFGQYIAHATLNDTQPLLPNTSHYIWATCTDDDGGFVDPCNLSYDTGYNTDSGGHYHNTGRESSSFTPAFGNAAHGQNVQITTKAYAQEECFEACPTGLGDCAIVDYVVGNGLPDISLFWNGEHTNIWYLTGAPPTRTTTGHGDINVNRYMQSTPAIGLYNATNDYLAAHAPQAKICTNDQSLPWGGLFDYEAENNSGGPPNPWNPPHAGHRDGKAADINFASSAQCPDEYGINATAFKDACIARGGTRSAIESDHVHCQWP